MSNDRLERLLSMRGILAFLGLSALFMAFVLQYILDYAPCELCHYERIPYACLLIYAVFLSLSKRAYKHRLPMAILGVSILLSSFHIGVEQHWWEYHASCTSTVMSASGDLSSIKEALLAAQMPRCDVPSYLFGVSLTLLNLLYSITCVVILLCAKKRLDRR